MNELENDIFNLHDEQPKPEAGMLLIAKPNVSDPCFKRAVIMLISHGDKGSMGLILNKPTAFNFSDINKGTILGPEDAPLFMGGPVQPQVMFYLHTLGPDVVPSSVHLTGDFYLGGDYNALKEYMATARSINDSVKFILGYSGWTAGQLQSEIDRHDWAVLNCVDTEMIMEATGDEMWREAVAQFGPRYRTWLNWPSNVNNN